MGPYDRLNQQIDDAAYDYNEGRQVDFDSISSDICTACGNNEITGRQCDDLLYKLENITEDY